MSYNKIVESGIYALVLCHLSGYTDTKALAYYIHYLYIMTLVMANILIYDANEYDATMTRLCNTKLRLFAANTTPNLPSGFKFSMIIIFKRFS